MSITHKLVRLGVAARRLNDDSDKLNRSIAQIDALLERMGLGLEFLYPRPVVETTSFDADGKRLIELSYVGYMKLRGRYTLALKTLRVFESRTANPSESPGSAIPLLDAPRRLRYAAVDVLPEVIAGLSHQVDELAAQMERRCGVADQVLRELELHFGAAPSDSHHDGVLGYGRESNAAAPAQMPGGPAAAPAGNGPRPAASGWEAAEAISPRERRRTAPRGLP